MKKRFKMYKAGKLWLIAAGLFVSDVAIANNAKADTTAGQQNVDNKQTTDPTDVQATNASIQQQQVSLNQVQPVATTANQAAPQTNEETSPKFKQASNSQDRANAGTGLGSEDQAKINNAINNKKIVLNSQNSSKELDKGSAFNHFEAEQSRAEQSRAEQSRAEQSRAEQLMTR